MMSRKTHKIVRTGYYIGIVLLVANTISIIRQYVGQYLDYEVTAGIPLITIVGLLVAAGAVMAYNRDL